MVKSRRYANERHLSHVRKKNCLLHGIGCSGPIEAHHLMKPWFGYRGMGMKSGDMNVVPLCNGHHMGLHHLGNEDKFWEACGKQSDYGRASAIRIWETSPVKEELEEWTPKVIKR